MKKIISLMLFLGIVSAVCGGVLSYVNGVTAPIIEEMSIAAEKENLELLFPGEEFKQIEFTDESGLVNGVYEVVGKGYVYKTTVTGYNSSTPIIFMIAFDNDGNIVGFKELQQQETNGIGQRVFTEEFTSNLEGKTSADPIAPLSGATVTSNAVISGINAAKAIFNESAGITVDPNAQAEPVEPTLATGNPVKLSDDFAEYEATVETLGDGVFKVSAKGFGLLQSDASHGYVLNEFEVSIKDGAVVSVKCNTFGDTAGLGDKATGEDYLAMFEGVTLDSEIDTCTGATFTSKSVVASVQAALNAAQE